MLLQAITAAAWQINDVESTNVLQDEAPISQTSIEAALFDHVNWERSIRGLTPVEFDPALLMVARVRAAAQPARAALSHYDGGGHLMLGSELASLGLSYELAGENLARVAPDTIAAEAAARALMNSPAHRAIILEPSFNRLAVGSATDSVSRIVFAQIFRAV